MVSVWRVSSSNSQPAIRPGATTQAATNNLSAGQQLLSSLPIGTNATESSLVGCGYQPTICRSQTGTESVRREVALQTGRQCEWRGSIITAPVTQSGNLTWSSDQLESGTSAGLDRGYAHGQAVATKSAYGFVRGAACRAKGFSAVTGKDRHRLR